MYHLFAGPKLEVSPLYYLKVPHDAEAHFKCGCGAASRAVCQNNNIAWSINNETTGESVQIYKNGQLLRDSKLYEITHTDGGASSNLTIHGKWIHIHVNISF